jgi:nitrous oxidase accessory protein NosD
MILSLILALTLVFSIAFFSNYLTTITNSDQEKTSHSLQTGPIITILADGSINPVDTQSINQVGTTYLITRDTGSQLVIERSDVTLDGNNHLFGGVSISNQRNVSVENLSIQNGDVGIQLSNCTDCNIRNNNLFGVVYGIQLINSSQSKLTDNQIDGDLGNGVITPQNYPDSAGIILYNSNLNILTNNTIKNNLNALSIANSSLSLIYHNNFIDNTANLGYWSVDNGYYDSTGNWISNLTKGLPNAIFDDGEAGNYWSNYNGSDTNNDRIGDEPFLIDSNNIDNFPLMHPFVTVTSQQYSQDNQILVLYATLGLITVFAIIVFLKKLPIKRNKKTNQTKHQKLRNQK